MPRLTLTLDGETTDLPDGALPALQRIADRHNANNAGERLTLLAFLARNILEIAVADDLAPLLQEIRDQRARNFEADVTAAVTTARDELIAALSAA